MGIDTDTLSGLYIRDGHVLCPHVNFIDLEKISYAGKKLLHGFPELDY
jgi:hypothetical protein